MQRIFTISSTAHDQQVHLALVRRQSCGVDHRHVVFSMRVVRWLCVCARPHAIAFASAAGGDSHRLAVAGCAAGVHHPSRRELEAYRRGGASFSSVAHFGSERGGALFLPGDHRAFGAALVFPHRTDRLGIPALCLVQHWLFCGITVLPIYVRALV